jgi:hypothetical protein
MGTRAIWKVEVGCVRDAKPFTADKSLWLRKNIFTDAIFPCEPRSVTGILTYLFYLLKVGIGRGNSVLKKIAANK